MTLNFVNIVDIHLFEQFELSINWLSNRFGHQLIHLLDMAMSSINGHPPIQ